MRHTLLNYAVSIALAMTGLMAIPTTAAAQSQSSAGCGPLVGPSSCPPGSNSGSNPNDTVVISTRPCMVIPGKEGCTVVDSKDPVIISTRPCMVIPGKEGCTVVDSNTLINAKKIVEVRGVSQAQPKPNICATRPEAFKGCATFQ